MVNLEIFSSTYSLVKWFALFAQLLLWCVSVIQFYKWLMRRKRAEKAARKLPCLKVPFFSLLGDLGNLPSATVMKQMSLSIPAYAIQMLSGYAAMFRKSPMYLLRTATTQGVFLTRQDSVEELLSSNIVLKKASLYKFVELWLGNGLLTGNGSKWKSRRKILSQSFHTDILKNFVSAFDEQSKILVGILRNKVHEDWIDIVEPITLCSLDIICETMLGVHLEAQTKRSSNYVAAVRRVSRAAVERAIHPILYPDIIFRFSKLGRQFRSDVGFLQRFTKEVIQEKKQVFKSKSSQRVESTTAEDIPHCKKRSKAVMDLLLDIHMNSEGEFTEEDVREEINTFLFAGQETTALGMTWTLYLIGLYPDVQTKVRHELHEIFGEDKARPVTVNDVRKMQYLERVIKETLRLYPPASLFGRHLTEDVSICGCKIRKGTEVVVNTYALHRNPDAFPDPERFDPDRFLEENCVSRNPFAYVPFSSGPRNCIGQRFAMMETKVIISNVLRNFQIKSLAPRDQIHPVLDITLRPGGPLKVKFSVRNSTT